MCASVLIVGAADGHGLEARPAWDLCDVLRKSCEFDGVFNFESMHYVYD